MAEIPNVCLSLPNRPENVLVVRQALTGVAGAIGLDAVETNDLNTAVTEACNNVVMHAYRGDEGPLEVGVYVLEDAVAVVVGDRGVGIGPLPELDDGDELRTGLGLPVIQALAREVEIGEREDGGTLVRMEFPAPTAGSLEPLADGEGCSSLFADISAPASDVELRLAPNALARAVLPRVLSALAARARFSTDRISDVQIVADVLAAKSPESISGSHLDVGVAVAPRDLRLRLGPLHSGRGQSLLEAAADGKTPVIEQLTDGHDCVLRDDAQEMLELRLLER
ncbi:MAG TPA: ATP-binding protein [Solirubrobacteraceae bacterium]